MADEITTQDELVEKLLQDFSEEREALKKMITDLELLKEKIDTLFPTSVDFRKYTKSFEEKVKAATGLFSTLLDIRKEIIRSIKDEIDLRKKLTIKDNTDFENIIDVRSLAKRYENLKQNILKGAANE